MNDNKICPFLSSQHLPSTHLIFTLTPYPGSIIVVVAVIPTLWWKTEAHGMSNNSFKISRLMSGRPGILVISHLPSLCTSSPQFIFWSGWANCSFLKAPDISFPLCLRWGCGPALPTPCCLTISYPSFNTSSTVNASRKPPKPQTLQIRLHTRNILSFLWTCHNHAYF